MDLVLFTAPGSNCSQRIEWVLRYKDIKYRKVQIENTSDSPNGYIPYMAIDGAKISESMAISEYLEEQFTDRPLFPDSPLERARVREICEFVNSTVHPPQNATILRFLRPDLATEAKEELRAKWITESLNRLKPRLFKASSFVVGNSFSVADIFVAVIYSKGQARGAPKDEVFDQYLLGLVEIQGYEVLNRERHNN